MRQVRRPVTVATLRQADVAFQKAEADLKRVQQQIVCNTCQAAVIQAENTFRRLLTTDY